MLIGQQLVQATGKITFMSRLKFLYSAKKNNGRREGKAACGMGFKEVEEAFRKHRVKDKHPLSHKNTVLPEGYEEGDDSRSCESKKSTHYTSHRDVYGEYLACLRTWETEGIRNLFYRKGNGHAEL